MTIAYQRLLIILVVSVVLFVLMPIGASADGTVDSVTFDGDSTVTVAGGTEIEVALNVSLSGSDGWGSTTWTIGSETGCAQNSTIYSDVLVTEEFTVSAPNEGGLYDVDFTFHSDSSCSNNTSTYTVADAVIVTSLAPIFDCTSGDVTYGLPQMEVAAFTVINTYSYSEVTTVNFTQDFDSAPLVFTLPTDDGNNTAAHRIRNVTASGFEIMTLEPEGEDGPHVAMGLNYLAIEPGVYVMPDGHKLEACSFPTTRARLYGSGDEAETVPFYSDFDQTPALLGQVQTMNNEVGSIPTKPSKPWLTTAISDVSATSANIGLERSESVSGDINVDERVAYVAAEPTSGRQSFSVEDAVIEYEILRTDADIRGWDDGFETFSYSEQWTNASGTPFSPIPLASMNTRGGDSGTGEDDGGWLRRYGESVTYESQRVRLTADEVRRGSYNSDGNRRKTVGERAGIFVFSDNFVTNRVSLDHIRFIHSATGVTCLPTTVDVYACSDADCNTLYTDNVTLNLQPSGTASTWFGTGVMADQVEFTGGAITLELGHYKPGTITLSAGGTPLPLNSETCLSGGEESDCTMAFSDSGFIFDVPDHVSAVDQQNITLAAVTTDTTTRQCVPSFGDVTRELSFSYTYANPVSGTVPVVVNSADIDSTGTDIDLTFDSDGETLLTVSYADVGDMTLEATYAGTAANEDDGLIMTGSDDFIASPASFRLTVPGNPAATDASGSVFAAAGADFNVEVSALNANGAVTPNYGQETIAEDVALTVALIAPAGEHNPILTGSFAAFGIDCDGASKSGYACGQFSWPEVGIITLTPEVADGDYLETGNVTGTVSGNIGRFIPDHFVVTANEPLIFDACSSGSFTYIGQPFSYLIDPQLSLTAVAEGGDITQNYGNDFWKYSSSLSGRDYSHASSGFPDVDIAITGSVSIAGDADYNGIGTVTIAGEWLNYEKTGTAIGPFDSDIDLEVSAADLSDSDGVCYDADNDGTCDSYTISGIGDSEQRYGQLQMQNAYGPETLDLELTTYAVYYTAAGYVRNNEDSCSSLSSTFVMLSDFSGNLASGETSLSGSGNLVDGVSTVLTLSAPGSGNDGNVLLEYDLDSAGLEWLNIGGNNPTARASFGLYQGNPRLIYTRESIW